MLTDLAQVCRASGLRVFELPGWKTRTRPASTGGFDPKGVLCHHTGADTDTVAYAEWLANVGRSDLPPPLAQLSIDRSGVVYVLAAGRANHAGTCKARGDWLQAGDGNTQLIGIEAMNNGTEGWSAAQYGAYVRLAAALCLHYDWPASHVLGHKETSTTGKWDPGDMDMDAFRRDVAKAMADRTPQEDDMPSAQEVAEAVWHARIGRGNNEASAAAHLVSTHRLLTTLSSLPDDVAEAVSETAQQDLKAGGGIDPKSLRRIVYAEAARALNTRLGSLDEGK